MLPLQDLEHDPIVPKLLLAAEFGRQCFVPVFVQISLDAFLRRIWTAQRVLPFDHNSAPTLMLTLGNNENIIWICQKIVPIYRFFINQFKITFRITWKISSILTSRFSFPEDGSNCFVGWKFLMKSTAELTIVTLSLEGKKHTWIFYKGFVRDTVVLE